jgi:hypothetical protein
MPVSVLAVLVSRRRVLLGLFMLPVGVMMGCLQMMVCGTVIFGNGSKSRDSARILTTRSGRWAPTLPVSVHRSVGWYPTTRPGPRTRPASSVGAIISEITSIKCNPDDKCADLIGPEGPPAATGQIARCLPVSSARAERQYRDVKKRVIHSGDRPRTVPPTAQPIKCKLSSSMSRPS